MRESVPSYSTGDAIRVGDRITYAGSRGCVVFVVATRSYCDEYPEEDWSFLGRGFMIETEAHGLIHQDEGDEDLILVERARPHAGAESASDEL